MKAVIVSCFGEMIATKFGMDKWQESLEAAGLSRNARFLATQDVDDATIFKVVENACRLTRLSPGQAADAFGEFWVTVFAPRLYQVYFRGVTSARDFLLKMDDLHDRVTKNIPNAKPPRFEYKWKDERTLVMRYRSTRGMIDWLVGLVKAVGKRFNERLSVRKTSESDVEVVFLSAAPGI